jgi:hypothetical protein
MVLLAVVGQPGDLREIGSTHPVIRTTGLIAQEDITDSLHKIFIMGGLNPLDMCS